MIFFKYVFGIYSLKFGLVLVTLLILKLCVPLYPRVKCVLNIQIHFE